MHHKLIFRLKHKNEPNDILENRDYLLRNCCLKQTHTLEELDPSFPGRFETLRHSSRGPGNQSLIPQDGRLVDLFHFFFEPKINFLSFSKLRKKLPRFTDNWSFFVTQIYSISWSPFSFSIFVQKYLQFFMRKISKIKITQKRKKLKNK